jgi:hypothetical protein
LLELLIAEAAECGVAGYMYGANVLNNSYMHTIFKKKLKYSFLRYTRSKVKLEDLENITVLNILV